jgi:hypothetical protein
MSLGSAIKRIFGGRLSPDEEEDVQEEYHAPDPGLSELEHRPADPQGIDLGTARHELEALKPPRDPNP